MVSPPTRGWTYCDRTEAPPRRGFPAHAGMDPGGRLQPPCSPWFPRPRGDGPWRETTASVLSLVSPPTRGWTLSAPRSAQRVLGFPAHAGMDPSSPHVFRSAPRFPRPRGDGPAAGVADASSGRVSPPTRGWTSERSAHRHPRSGFPAHAGMDPRSRSSRSPSRWFPRPRGDGPKTEVVDALAELVSPPTRGWTPVALIAPQQPFGFPAHAGMDPLPDGEEGRTPRFPRPRGDGPSRRNAATPRPPVSLPTRGWTLIEHAPAGGNAGFPAHAGMDRLPRDDGVLVNRFPRPRGDGPLPRSIRDVHS